jgi:hypothetical protein
MQISDCLTDFLPVVPRTVRYLQQIFKLILCGLPIARHPKAETSINQFTSFQKWAELKTVKGEPERQPSRGWRRLTSYGRALDTGRDLVKHLNERAPIVTAARDCSAHCSPLIEPGFHSLGVRRLDSGGCL